MVRHRRGDVVDGVAGYPIVGKVRRRVYEEIGRGGGDQRDFRQRHRAGVPVRERDPGSDSHSGDDDPDDEDRHHRGAANGDRIERAHRGYGKIERLPNDEQPRQE